MNSPVEHSIFVGGLSNSVTNDNLKAYFSQFGNVVDCEAQMWKNNPNKCRGFAIIKVANEEVYNTILSKPHKLDGRAIECKKVIQNKTELDQHSKEEQDKKVFVSGLSKKVNDEMLRAYFEQYAEVKMAYVVKHHKDKKSRGIGYITFANKEDKESILLLTDLTLDNKPIYCSEYSTKFNLKQQGNVVKDPDNSQKSTETTEHSPKLGSEAKSVSFTSEQPQELSAKAMMLREVLNIPSKQKINMRMNRTPIAKSVAAPRQGAILQFVPLHSGYRLY